MRTLGTSTSMSEAVEADSVVTTSAGRGAAACGYREVLGIVEMVWRVVYGKSTGQMGCDCVTYVLGGLLGATGGYVGVRH